MSLRDDLIHIIDNRATPSAYALTVNEFKDLTVEELAFVYFTTDHKSPFSVYEWEQRVIEVKNSIFGKKNNFKPSAKRNESSSRSNEKSKTRKHCKKRLARS